MSTTYSGSGQVASVTEPSSGAAYVSSISFTVAGQMAGITLGSGITETYTYDGNRLQLTQQKAVTSGNATLVNLNYSYQAAAGQMGAGTTAGNASQLMAINNNSTINGSSESAAYTYDLERRLATSTQTSNGQTAARRFDYDRWGNRLDEWDALNGGNELQTIALAQTNGVTNNRIQSVTPAGGGPVTYAFDANGNLTGDGAHTYQYDAENRVKSVDNAGTASYAYDYMNRRVKKTVGSTTTHYIWEHGNVLAEHNATNGAGVADYVYAANLLVGTGPGNLLGGNGSFTYFLSDRLNTRILTDRYGNYLGQQSHLPFGEDLAESGTQDKHHLTTYERDSEASTDYASNREYEFNMGRFMAADPIVDSAFSPGMGSGCSGKRGQVNPKNPQSLNLFGYAGNDPINSSDPTGLETLTTCAAVAAAVIPALPYWDGYDDFDEPLIGIGDYGVEGGLVILIEICITIDLSGADACGQCCTNVLDNCARTAKQKLKDIKTVGFGDALKLLVCVLKCLDKPPAEVGPCAAKCAVDIVIKDH